VQSYDRRAVLQYSRPDRTREAVQRFRVGPAVHHRSSSSRKSHNHKRAHTVADRWRSLYRDAYQQPFARKLGEDADGSRLGVADRGRSRYRDAYQIPVA